MAHKGKSPLAGMKGSILGGKHPLDDKTRQEIATPKGPRMSDEQRQAFFAGTQDVSLQVEA